MTVGDRIKAARKQAKLTQQEVADKIGIKAQTFQKYERGERNPKIETIQKIADALEIDASDLYDAVPDRKGLELVAPPPDPDPREAELLGNFHQLNEAGQDQLLTQSRYLLTDDRYKKEAQSASS
jgi:transcriptional regulator with XRE-family HTH domain